MITEHAGQNPNRDCAPRLVVVTGVCGFIGSHLAERFLEQEHINVLGIDRLEHDADPRTSTALKELRDRRGFRFVSADAGSAKVAQQLSGASAVVHLAAPTDVGASWGKGFAEQAISLLSTQQLLNACWDAQVPRIVVASSAHVYGPLQGLAREDIPAEPTSPYGAVKLATERLAVAYARRPASRMSVVGLRFFTAFGPRSNPAMVVPRMFRSAVTGEAMPLYGDGSAIHTWTHIDDLVDAILRAVDLPMDDGAAEVVNVAGVDEASLRQVGDVVGDIVGRPVVWKEAGERAGDAAGVRADLARAREVLGFVPRVRLRDGLENLWQHLRNDLDEPCSLPSSQTAPA